MEDRLKTTLCQSLNLGKKWVSYCYLLGTYLNDLFKNHLSWESFLPLFRLGSRLMKAKLEIQGCSLRCLCKAHSLSVWHCGFQCWKM